jgi:hypothetical protein
MYSFKPITVLNIHFNLCSFTPVSPALLMKALKEAADALMKAVW